MDTLRRMLMIPVTNAQQAMHLKDQVLQAGLVLHEDFSWEYVPNQYDGYDDTSNTQPMAKFFFRDESNETWFKLKWS